MAFWNRRRSIDSTRMWFVLWNAAGLVIHFVWSSRNSRLAKGAEQAG